jgi:hypothetical protein
MNARLAGLETDVHWFTGALEGFLGRIRIDDGLCLVSNNRHIGSVDPAHFTLDFDRDLADGNAINMDSTVSKPDPLRLDPMVISEDDEAPSDLCTFVAGTATTPSDTVGTFEWTCRRDSPDPPPNPEILPLPLPLLLLEPVHLRRLQDQKAYPSLPSSLLPLSTSSQRPPRHCRRRPISWWCPKQIQL